MSACLSSGQEDRSCYSQSNQSEENRRNKEKMLDLGPSCGFCSDHCAAAQPSTSEVPAERLNVHVELIHLFVISIQDLERYKAD